MEFDPGQLSYLGFKFLKKINSNKNNVSFLYQDLKKFQNLRVIVFEKTENEKIIYKFMKELYLTKITETLLYRDSINGFPFLITQIQGPTLKKILKYMDFKLSPPCVMMIGLQIVR